MPAMTQKSWPLTVYVCLALALSLWALSHQYFIGHDGVFYARVGEHMVSGQGISANAGQPYTDHPPLYSFFIGLLYLLLRDSELAGHLVSVLAFGLTVIPLFLLARSVYGQAAAHWTAVLYATNGFLLVNSHVVAADGLFIFFMFAQWCVLHSLIQAPAPAPFAKKAACSGLLCGLAFLTRPEGLIFFALSLLALFLLSDMPAGKKTRAAAVSLACFAPLVFVQLAFVYHATHRLQLSTASTDLFIMRQMDMAHPNDYLGAKKIFTGLTPDKTRLQLYALRDEVEALPWLLKDGGALLKSAAASLISRLWGLSNYLFCGLGFVLIGASWLAGPWGRQRKKSEAFFLLCLMTFGFQLFAVFHPKRYLLYYPIFLMWMGHGLEVLRHWAKETFAVSARAAFGIAAAACLLFVLPSVWYVPRTIRLSPVPAAARQMGAWMKDNIPDIAAARVASRHPAPTYYATSNHVWLPYAENWEDLKTYLAYQGARYFLVSSDMDEPLLGRYKPLLDENAAAPSGFSRLHAVPGNPKMVLYQTAYRLESPP